MEHKHRILFADPDKNLTEFLRPFLRSKGFESMGTVSGNEFLDVIASVNPDVVIMDLDLDNPSAIEALRIIKKDEQLKSIPVILTSKGNQRELVRKAMSEGADDYLVKPFFLDLLCARLRINIKIREILKSSEKRKNHLEELIKEKARLKDCLIKTNAILSSLLLIDDPLLGGQPHFIMEYARSIAQHLRLDEETIDAVTLAALFHDIGIIGVDREILMKKGELSDAEFERIKTHISTCIKLFEHVDFPWNIKKIINHHHERFDGTGYPEGVSGEEIPVGSRILAVVDSFYAMIAPRPYRKPLSPEQALDEIRKRAGTQFDPRIVSALEDVIKEDQLRLSIGLKKKILIIDRDHREKAILKLRLVNEGFDVTFCEGIDEAIDKIKAEPPDIILSETELSDGDCLKLMRRLKSDATSANIPVVIYTSDPSSEKKMKTIKEGAEDYFSKDIAWDEFTTRLKSILRRYKRSFGVSVTLSGGVRGTLDLLSFADMVYLFHMREKTGKITLKGKRVGGECYFEKGRIVHASCGELTGRDAFFQLLMEKEGEFSIEHDIKSPVVTISGDSIELLLEGTRRFDERSVRA